MTSRASIEALLESGYALRGIEADIHSVIPVQAIEASYDRMAGVYDLLIGNPIYNRLLWGSWPSRYACYCRDALQSSTGPVLDAGCGTLIFTAEEYLRESGRPIVLVDRSLGMLRRARQRLRKKNGTSFPAHIALLQADMRSLPFRAGGFATVLSWGTLHLFDDSSPILKELRRVVTLDGKLFLTSLVTGRRFADRYLGFLHSRGEVAQPVNVDTLHLRLKAAGLQPHCEMQGSMAYCSATRVEMDRLEAIKP